MRAKRIGFSSPFPCDIDNDFHRFMSMQRQNNVTPWPEMLDESSLTEAWSNPFVRLWYIPTTKPHRLMEGYREQKLPLKQWLAVIHEETHLVLDFTPAKELIRLYLSEIHHIISSLLGPRDMHKNIYNKNLQYARYCLNSFHEAMNINLTKIELSEELIANARSFDILERQLTQIPGRIHEIELLNNIELKLIKTKSKAFQDLYPGFKKAVRLGAVFPSPAWLARLAIFLQPVIKVGQFTTTINSEDRCEKLVNYIGNATSAWQLVSWLEKEISAEDRMGWATVLAQAVITSHTKPMAIGDLWMLARGIKPEENMDILSRMSNMDSWARKAQNAYLNWSGPKQNRWSTGLLYPKEVDGHWYIQFESWGVDNFRHWTRIFYHESIRQQINQGIGIRCPLRDVAKAQKCVCTEIDPILKEGIIQFAQWIKEENYADGNWTDLSFPCG